jgi:hypothetical protein
MNTLNANSIRIIIDRMPEFLMLGATAKKKKNTRSVIGELCSPHYHPFNWSDLFIIKRAAALIKRLSASC